MRNSHILLFFFLLMTMFWVQSCENYEDLSSIDRPEEEIEIAVPLINTEFLISDFTGEGGPENVSIRVDSEDRVTLIYNGDVVRQNVNAVFQPVPFFEFPVLDTFFTIPVPFASDQRVDKAIFGNTNFKLNFISDFEEDVEVKVTIPQLSKNGEQFSVDLTVPYNGSIPVEYTSDLFSVQGWTLESEENIIDIIYDARLADGSKQKFTAVIMAFDVIVFDYVEGYFGSEVFDINGDFIAIGILDNWVSGGLSFEDPKVKVFVENAFGFPVRSIFNKMQVVTTTGEVLDMESEIIDNNVDFAYPALDEPGVVKITEFSFDKDNSNIVDLFKEKVSRVTYDIDAGANPDMDESITGFVNEDSYFLVSVDVELPLEGTVNNLVLQDEVELDLGDLDDITRAEFKTIVANDFPADVSLQGYIYDDNNGLLDSLFEERLLLSSATLDPSTGKTLPADEVTIFTEFTEDRFVNLKNGKKVVVDLKINTEQTSSGALWIYNDYGILFKVGAKFITKL
ncbi:MAG: hypothetical protein P1U56_05085 [Saprospiraceae bacterium]|nr:hypothetical protein [Saprospiraceae bacterium]